LPIGDAAILATFTPNRTRAFGMSRLIRVGSAAQASALKTTERLNSLRQVATMIPSIEAVRPPLLGIARLPVYGNIEKGY
jgi:hypothetical protein